MSRELDISAIMQVAEAVMSADIRIGVLWLGCFAVARGTKMLIQSQVVIKKNSIFVTQRLWLVGSHTVRGQRMRSFQIAHYK